MSTYLFRDPKPARTRGRSDKKTWALVLGLSLLMSACYGPTQSDGMESSDEAPDGSTEDKLFSAGGSSAIWDRHIHYCFLPPASQYNSLWQKRKVDFAQVMKRTWNSVGVIQLISDGDCPASPGRYVVTVKYDYPGDGWSNARVGMRSTVNNTGTDVNISVGFLTGKVSGHDGNVAHEMGHILGFNHEKDRTNSCGENAVSDDDASGAIYWTSNDPGSLMNFSYCDNSGTLTEKDKQGLRKAYAHLGGNPPPPPPDTTAKLVLVGAQPVSPGATLTLKYSGLKSTNDNWIAIWKDGAAAANYVDKGSSSAYKYITGASGSASLKSPAVTGRYTARIYYNDSYSEEAARVVFTVGSN